MPAPLPRSSPSGLGLHAVAFALRDRGSSAFGVPYSALLSRTLSVYVSCASLALFLRHLVPALLLSVLLLVLSPAVLLGRIPRAFLCRTAKMRLVVPSLFARVLLSLRVRLRGAASLKLFYHIVGIVR